MTRPLCYLGMKFGDGQEYFGVSETRQSYQVFWYVTPCRPVNMYRPFEGSTVLTEHPKVLNPQFNVYFLQYVCEVKGACSFFSLFVIV
jgi:hypothetical protein